MKNSELHLHHWYTLRGVATRYMGFKNNVYIFYDTALSEFILQENQVSELLASGLLVATPLPHYGKALLAEAQKEFIATNPLQNDEDANLMKESV